MKVTYDPHVDAMRISLNDAPVAESDENKPGVILDYDKDDRVVGVEFLGISTRATKAELSSLQFQTA